ncbi:MAG TPA: hypothetical protein VH414_06395 [Lichenihabitans sp.]|jgi:uncharacterized membrane protein|nr:hypothetical protein [Lichenihabitans sp.]
MTGRIVPAALWALATLFVAGIVHLGSVLLVPRLATETAFARLSAAGQGTSVTPLPPASGAQSPVPFRDAALSSAVCRYDLSGGPLRVTAGVVHGDFTAVSFHSRTGRPFYGLTENSAVEGKIEVLLATAAQLARIEAADPGDEPIRDVRIAAPEDEGFVEFDVLPRVGGIASAERALASMSCKVERTL